MDVRHDFRYLEDHDVEDLKLFFIYRLEEGAINRSYRDQDLCRIIKEELPDT